MKPAFRALALLTFAVLIACGGGGGGGGGGSSLTAAWRWVSGPAFAGPPFSDQDFEGTLRFLVLNDDGTLELLSQDEGSDTLFCNHGVYSTTHDGLVLEIRREFSSVTILFLRDQPDGQTLVLTDVTGEESVFDREAAVPASLECLTLNVQTVHSGYSAVPTFFTGLAFDGTFLWFTDENEEDVFPIDPMTGALGVPVQLVASQFQMVHACQGTDFWTHCRCGGSQEAQRRTQADVFVDQVDTENDLLNEISVRGIAYDAVGNVLWLHGFGRDDRIARFLQVDSNAEPDVLLSSDDFNVDLLSIAWDGTNMWGITSIQNIVRIDVGTFKATATYETPDVNVEWRGIASAPASSGIGTSLYLIGRDTVTGEGVLAEVQP